MTVADRAFEVAAATMPRAPKDCLAHPFGFAHPDRPHTWRVSRDVWEQLRAYVGFWVPENPTADARLLGEPIRIDESLPPNSMLLEPPDA